MSLGFIILRHVNSKITDLYWKECYTCIRKFYNEPILIIDDSSNKEYLCENIVLENCTVVYDTDHKGKAEILPYYYFHKLKPFETAVVLHDCVFLQSKIDFHLADDESIRFLWSFSHLFDADTYSHIHDLLQALPLYEKHMALYPQKDKWVGMFGVMSVIRWSLIDTIQTQLQFFDTIMPQMTTRGHRCALERVLGLVAHHYQSHITSYFGDIHFSMPYGASFFDYLQGRYTSLPIMRVWTGR
jgi:hypothetical protein